METNWFTPLRTGRQGGRSSPFFIQVTLKILQICYRSTSIQLASYQDFPAICHSDGKVLRKVSTWSLLSQLELAWGLATLGTYSVKSVKALYALRFLGSNLL
jgi:hypothetical protein